MSIIIDDIAYQHSNRTTLFKHLSCSIETGQHVNLIGNNGSGKSTLLRIIAGELEPSEGNIATIAKPYYVPQQVSPALTVIEALQVGGQFKALQAILHGETQQQFFEQLADEWDIEEQVKKALGDWQLNYINPTQPMHSLSGGEQTRVLLAGMTLKAYPIILLDEPTNHLDIRGREQLYGFMQKYKGTLVVVSHDRRLLQLNNTTLALTNGVLQLYGGNYEFYKLKREEELTALQENIQFQKKELKRAKKTAQLMKERRQRQEGRNKENTDIPRIAINTLKNSAERSTAKLEAVHDERKEEIFKTLQDQRRLLGNEQVLQVRFPDSRLHRGKKLVEAIGVNYCYDKKMLWDKGLDFRIDSGQRISIRGNNGSGKSTLLKLITGMFNPTAGMLERAPCEILYLDQQYSFIDTTKTVFKHAAEFNEQRMPEHSLKMLLHQYQLTSDFWDLKCAHLSGGEKLKLTLCCLFLSNANPDIIVLDEPANNLDIQSLEVLINALKEYNGTLVVVSHDTSLMEAFEIVDYLDLC